VLLVELVGKRTVADAEAAAGLTPQEDTS
jgi:hypothetical protein